MMELMERAMWLSIGGVFGFILGYIVRSLRDIRELERVEEAVSVEVPSESKWDRDERGFMQHRAIADVIMLFVLAITVWAVFSTAAVNQDLKTVNKQIVSTVDCISNYNIYEGEALKARDVAFQHHTQSEIDLWAKYENLYRQAKADPTKIPVLQERLNKAIMKHRESLRELQKTRHDHPYPSPFILEYCKNKEL